MDDSSASNRHKAEKAVDLIGERKIGRRAVLGLSFAATVGMFTGVTSHPVPASAQILKPHTVAPGVWPSSLRVLQPARGVTRTFTDVYVMTSISQVVSMTKPAGAPLLAITMTGTSNQLQIIDPMGGVRVRVVDLPDNQVVRGLVWETKSRTLYFGATNGRVYAYHYDTATLVDLGRAAPKATTLYGLSLDSTGRLWGGSYPEGIIWNYTPDTKKFVQLPRIDSTTDYVRALAITTDDTVYVGTGTTAPKVVCFPAGAPAERKTLSLPGLPATGFVLQLSAKGDQVLINADTVETQLIWNHRTKTLTAAASTKALNQSSETPATETSYWVNNKVLYSTNTTTGQDTLLGDLGISAPEHIWASNGSVYVLSRAGTQATTHSFDLQSKQVAVQSSTTLKGAAVEVHSLLAHTDGNLYIGGYQGQGISTLNPDTGARWQSPDTVAPNQITGMVKWDESKVFIGSYGSADIIRFATPRMAEGNNAFKHMERLRTKYGQSRPIGWARNTSRVFFGTVPDYGLAGGALGIINPGTDTIEAVYNKLIPNHSIIGLVADEKYVYGTTSTRNGYGSPDTPGNAKVFAFDLATRKLAWSREIPGYRAVMNPVLVDGKIIGGTVEGIVVLEASTGILVQKYSFTGRLDRNYRPGWTNVSLKRLGNSHRFVHAGGKAIHVIDIQNGTLRKADGAFETGTALAVTADGRVFTSHKACGIAEISTEPTRPGIRSIADLVSVSPAGVLSVRQSNGKGIWGTPNILGSGWNYETIKSFHVVDWQSRGVLDILVQRTDGTLNLHQANGSGIYPTSGRRLSGGWAAREISVGRFSATVNEPAMVSADTAGNLYLHEVIRSTGGMRTAKRLGAGFKGYKLCLLDIRGKGYADIVGHKGSGLSWWQNNGDSTLGPHQVLRSAGWFGVSHLSPVKKHYGNNEGLVYRTKAGEMRYISAKQEQLVGIISSGINLGTDVIAGG